MTQSPCPVRAFLVFTVQCLIRSIFRPFDDSKIPVLVNGRRVTSKKWLMRKKSKYYSKIMGKLKTLNIEELRNPNTEELNQTLTNRSQFSPKKIFCFEFDNFLSTNFSCFGFSHIIHQKICLEHPLHLQILLMSQ